METTERAEAPDDAGGTRAAAKRPGWLRFVPIAVIALGAAAAVVFGGDYLSFSTLADNRDALVAWRDENFAATLAVYVLAYTVAVAFSVPGAVWFTLAGGFLFGTWLATALTVVAATAGASLVFLAARTSLGELLRARAGGWLGRVERGYREGEVSFLLVMRLVPAIPFFVANLAPAFLGTRLRTFAWTTLVGIIPGTAVFSSLGAGLGTLIDRGERPDLGVIFDPSVLGPLLGLAALAALPAIVKKLRGRPV